MSQRLLLKSSYIYRIAAHLQLTVLEYVLALNISEIVQYSVRTLGAGHLTP